MILFRLSILFFVFFLSVPAFAQRLITARVLDSTTKKPVGDVAVTIYKGTSYTITRNNGYFQLTVHEGDSLLLTHQNYNPGLIAIPDADVFSIYIVKNNFHPEYLDGEANLYGYIKQNLKYTRTARLKGIEALLFVELLVDSTGNIVECKTLNEIGGKCEKEAISVFEKIPGKWSHSHQTTRFIFPVVFSMGIKEMSIETPQIDLPEGKIMSRIIITAEFY